MYIDKYPALEDCNTCQTQGIMDNKRPDTHLHHLSTYRRDISQLNKLAALHFYQKMAHSS